MASPESDDCVGATDARVLLLLLAAVGSAGATVVVEGASSTIVVEEPMRLALFALKERRPMKSLSS